jgi:hypothetical protein
VRFTSARCYIYPDVEDVGNHGIVSGVFNAMVVDIPCVFYGFCHSIFCGVFAASRLLPNRSADIQDDEDYTREMLNECVYSVKVLLQVAVAARTLAAKASHNMLAIAPFSP